MLEVSLVVMFLYLPCSSREFSTFLSMAGKTSPNNNKMLPAKTKTTEILKVTIKNPPVIGPKMLPKKVILLETPKTFPRCWEGVDKLMIVFAIGIIAP